uniref:DUF1670 domain-containing protein n=1 Tax=Haemonchus contortus TaxID=6289 RepID=A0A7I4YMP4_HAECO
MKKTPLCWVKGAGSNGDINSFRAEMSSDFWDFFLQSGKKNLYDYNRKSNCNVKLIRNQTIEIADVENLGLYLRRKIREVCVQQKISAPEMLVKNGFLTIGRGHRATRIRPTELAVRLGLDYSDWSGTPIKNLLTKAELLAMNAEMPSIFCYFYLDKVRKNLNDYAQNRFEKCMILWVKNFDVQ